MFLIFNFNFEYLKRRKSSEPLHKWIQPLACLDHGLYRILSGGFLFVEKIRWRLHYFGLDSGMLEYSTHKEQLLTFRHFWSTVRQKRLRFFAHTNRDLKLKLKNQKPIAVDDIFKDYLMIPLSCRSNLAGRYLLCYIFTLIMYILIFNTAFVLCC